MKAKIMQLVNEKHEESGGNCGIYLTQLISDLNACVIEIGKDISDLHKENLIDVRQGIHGVLIMKKSNDIRKHKDNPRFR